MSTRTGITATGVRTVDKGGMEHLHSNTWTRMRISKRQRIWTGFKHGCRVWTRTLKGRWGILQNMTRIRTGEHSRHLR